MSQSDTLQSDERGVLCDTSTRFPSDASIQIVSVDESGLLEMLAKLRESEEYIADLAPKLGVSAQHLANVLAGRKKFGPKLLRSLGVVRTYQMFDVEIVMDEGNGE